MKAILPVLCVMLAINGLVLAAAEVPKTPPAVTIKQIPDNLPNGERPWPELPETEIEKIRAALPDAAPLKPAKPRKLLVFYRTDGFPHASIPHWNKLIELLGQKTGAYTVTLSQNYADLSEEKLRGSTPFFLTTPAV